jgi:mannan endo-1,4-beta-mannosidase
MDVYTVNLGYKYHDDFYRQAKIKSTFKKYLKAFISRYRDSPAIMAWEIANEPRCGADGVRNLPRSVEGCNPEVMTKWIEEMSRYIRSLDKNHLITTGGEGAFYRPGEEDWAYNGADGTDFDGELELKNIDFGT